MADDLVVVARVARTRGLRGEVVADLYTDFPGRFEDVDGVIAIAPDGGHAGHGRRWRRRNDEWDEWDGRHAGPAWIVAKKEKEKEEATIVVRLSRIYRVEAG